MRELNPYWKSRQKSFWFDIIFGLACLVSGWFPYIEFLKHNTKLAFLPRLFAVGMALFKLWQSLYKERK